MKTNQKNDWDRQYDAGYDTAIRTFRELRRTDADAFRMALRGSPRLDLAGGDVVDFDAWTAGWRDAVDAVVDGENEARGIDNRYGEP